jgi:ribosomal protein S18 acetylase RimI-like enzyme
VYAIYVDPPHWGRGHGRELLDGAVRELRSAGFPRAVLWVLTTNDGARAFYERQGWRTTGRTQSEDLAGTTVHETEYARDL